MSSSRAVSRERRKIGQGQNLRGALERGSQKSLRRMREVQGEPEKCGGISARGAETQEGRRDQYYQMVVLHSMSPTPKGGQSSYSKA